MATQEKDEKYSRGRYRDITNAQIVKVFGKKGGNLSATADALGISRTTLYYWRNSDAELDEMMKEVEEGLIDFSESKLMEAIQDGNLTAIIFHLKTKGKNRGYIEGQEIKATVEHARQLSQEEARQMIQDLESQY